MPNAGLLGILSLLAAGFAAVSLLGAKLLRPSRPDPVKLSSYECGMPAEGSTQVRLNIRFHVFALLFVIFDAETLYVYPWAVSFKGSAGPAPTVAMAVFLAVLFLGLAYAWAKGALEWE